MTDGLLDASALLSWLTAHLPARVPVGSTLTVQQFPAGFSNLTYAVEVTTPDHTSALYVLRRPPRGVSGGSAHDMGREHDLLAALHPLGIPVPMPYIRCDDAAVIGAPFYLMAHVAGTIVRRPADLQALWPETPDTPAQLAALSHTVIATLARVHQVDVTRGPLATLGRPDGYVARQVAGWTKRWHAAKTTDVPALDAVAAWLEQERPPDRAAALIHNDFKLDNLVVAASASVEGAPHVTAILDWEMATIGDPLMDLGTTLAYWVEAGDAPIFRALGLGVTALPGSLTRAEVVQTYQRESGLDVSAAPFYFTFGLFKVAVIAQQIYARHVRGLTNDVRFATLDQVVLALAASATRVMTTGQL